MIIYTSAEFSISVTVCIDLDCPVRTGQCSLSAETNFVRLVVRRQIVRLVLQQVEVELVLELVVVVVVVELVDLPEFHLQHDSHHYRCRHFATQLDRSDRRNSMS